MQKISIDPVTRLEGHGRIDIFLNDAGDVANAYLVIPELRGFEKFAQGDASDTRQRGGTGLGLSIVKQIVSRLRGEVGFESAAGCGTLFFVELPREALDEEECAAAAGGLLVSSPRGTDGPGNNKEVA